MQWRSACNVPVWVTMSSHSHPVLRYALKHVNFLEVSSPHKKPRTQFSPSTTATKNTRYQLTQRHATPFQLSRARPGSAGIMWLYGDIYSSTRLWVVGWDDGASLFTHLGIDFPLWLRTHSCCVRSWESCTNTSNENFNRSEITSQVQSGTAAVRVFLFFGLFVRSQWKLVCLVN